MIMNMYKRWQLLTNIQIEKIGPGWIGISTLEDGKKVLIKGSVLPHSTIEGRIIKIRKDYVELEHIRTTDIDPSWSNVEPQCSHYHHPLQEIDESQVHRYGFAGCKWQIIPYDKQLELKADIVKESFRGHDYLLSEIWLESIIPSPAVSHYRNKVEFSFGKYITKKSNDHKAKGTEEVQQENKKENSHTDFSHYHTRQLGYHKQSHYDKIIDVDYCCLISEQANTIYSYIKKLCKESWLPVYDQRKHDGVLRNLMIREGSNTGQCMVNLILAQDNIPLEGKQTEWNTFLTTLKSDEFLQSHCTTFLITNNSTLSDAIRWKEATLETLWGDGYIHEELSFHNDHEEDTKLSFQISPTSFFQTNSSGAQALFQQAMSYAQLPDGKQTILDLYCGTGTIGLSFLKQGIGEKLLGIEIVEDAIADAHINASRNDLSEQSYFVAGKVEDLIDKDTTIKESLTDLGLVILDPPRVWLHPSVPLVLNKLKEQYNFQLIYISCNPVTLARDLDVLVQGGWKLETLQPVDMFPHTHHMEMISVLS